MKKNTLNIIVPANCHGYRIDKFLQSQIMMPELATELTAHLLKLAMMVQELLLQLSTQA